MKMNITTMASAVILLSAVPAFAAQKVNHTRTVTHYDNTVAAAPSDDQDYVVQDRGAVTEDNTPDTEDRTATRWYPVPDQGPDSANVVYQNQPDTDAVTTTTESYVVVDKNHDTMNPNNRW